MRSCTWDGQSRMIQCVCNTVVDGSPVTHTSDVTYGSDGLRRRMVTDATTTTDYILDGQSVAMEKVTKSDEAGERDIVYANGPRGPEFRVERRIVPGQSPEETVRWYVYDGLGSVVAEVDSQGTLNPDDAGAEHPLRRYDAYGALRNAADFAQCKSGSQQFVGALGHATEDSLGGLVYMRARYYDAESGRFVSEDPTGRESNWYAYCSNSPTNLVDRSGCEGDLGTELGVDTLMTDMGATLDSVGLSELEGDVCIQGGSAEFRINMIQSMGRGTFKVRSMMGLLRSWANANGINQMIFRGIEGSVEGGRAFKAALAIIKAAGDAGELVTDGPYTLLYWLMQ